MVRQVDEQRCSSDQVNALGDPNGQLHLGNRDHRENGYKRVDANVIGHEFIGDGECSDHNLVPGTGGQANRHANKDKHQSAIKKTIRYILGIPKNVQAPGNRRQHKRRANNEHKLVPGRDLSHLLD